MLRVTLASLALFASSGLTHAENRIDTQRPDAPELAAYGQYAVGIRTLKLVNKGQVDVAGIEASAAEGERPDPLPTTDRELTVELFYPAVEGASGDTSHDTFMRDGSPIELTGRSVRDAAPRGGESFPLVLLSHGYPGNRFLMAHLAENIASKGYVVASIDHPASIYTNLGAFADTLRHRPRDQHFVLNAIANGEVASGELPAGLVDADRTGLIGYSMGGYGALIAAGAGITEAGGRFPFGNKFGLPGVNVEGSATEVKPDPRIRTIITFGPWGRNYGMWDAAALDDISVPALLIAGSEDDVSGYEEGTKKIFEEMTGTNRALLTFEDANHNAGAPMPAPSEAVTVANASDGLAPWDHYGDAVWNNVRMNNISQHFVTAWLDRHVKGDEDVAPYLDLVPVADDGVYAIKDGEAQPEHTYWRGFPARTAKGLRFERRSKGE